jgi:uncharacterized membrane protein YfcA
MSNTALIASLMGAVSLLYATAGQAGGTAFVAVMAFASSPASEMRPTALFLIVVAAGYATVRLLRNGAVDAKTLALITLPSMATAFIGGLLVLDAPEYFALIGLLLVAAGMLMIFKRKADSVQTRAMPSLPAPRCTRRSGFRLAIWTNRSWGRRFYYADTRGSRLGLGETSRCAFSAVHPV